jgi:deoxyribose-phosphate aldolase
MDLTTLAGDDTAGNVKRLCAKARHPVRGDLLEALGVADLGLTVGAVCVYHAHVATAVEALAGSGIPVAAVSTGFPAGLSPMPQRIAEIRASVAAGATEIDVVITRGHVLRGDWQALYDEVRAFRDACGEAHLKTILGVGELGHAHQRGAGQPGGHDGRLRFHQDVHRQGGHQRHAARGAGHGAQIRDYLERTGHVVGFKPAGGIRTAKQSLDWLVLIKEELGDRWLRPDLFRFGASGLLTDIERQLEHFVTGRYSAAHRHPMV